MKYFKDKMLSSIQGLTKETRPTENVPLIHWQDAIKFTYHVNKSHARNEREK